MAGGAGALFDVRVGARAPGRLVFLGRAAATIGEVHAQLLPAARLPDGPVGVGEVGHSVVSRTSLDGEYLTMRRKGVSSEKQVAPPSLVYGWGMATLEEPMSADSSPGARVLHLRESDEPALFAALRKAAAENERSVAGQARLYLKRALKDDGYEAEAA